VCANVEHYVILAYLNLNSVINLMLITLPDLLLLVEAQFPIQYACVHGSGIDVSMGSRCRTHVCYRSHESDDLMVARSHN
jgi:hypothetical protein